MSISIADTNFVIQSDKPILYVLLYFNCSVEYNGLHEIQLLMNLNSNFDETIS